MDKIYLWLLLLISCSCSHTKEKVSNDMDSSLCIIDVTCEYPVEKVNIHDVADVEYVPLERHVIHYLRRIVPLFGFQMII